MTYFFSRLKADDNGKQALYCCIIENIGGIWGQAIKHNKAKNSCVWLKDILQTNLLKSVQSRFQSGLKRFSKALSWLLGCAYSGRSGSIIWSFRVAGFFVATKCISFFLLLLLLFSFFSGFFLVWMCKESDVFRPLVLSLPCGVCKCCFECLSRS